MPVFVGRPVPNGVSGLSKQGTGETNKEGVGLERTTTTRELG